MFAYLIIYERPLYKRRTMWFDKIRYLGYLNYATLKLTY